MSIEQADVVDSIGLENSTDTIILTISDHLPWNEPNHLLMLQEKLNSYIAFVESGDLLEAYPVAKGKRIVIDLVCAFPLRDDCRSFFDRVDLILREAGIELRVNVVPPR